MTDPVEEMVENSIDPEVVVDKFETIKNLIPMVAEWDDNQILGALIVTILTLIITLWFLTSKGKNAKPPGKGDVTLIWGPSGSGKTSLFYRLTNGGFPPTQTSMKANEAKLQVEGTQVTKFFSL